MFVYLELSVPTGSVKLKGNSNGTQYVYDCNDWRYTCSQFWHVFPAQDANPLW